MHDSDWFDGLCPCSDYPCIRAVAAQELLERAERRRERVVTAYRAHHGRWPQASFVDAVIEAVGIE